LKLFPSELVKVWSAGLVVVEGAVIADGAGEVNGAGLEAAWDALSAVLGGGGGGGDRG
jgi:hypothetical protein